MMFAAIVFIVMLAVSSDNISQNIAWAKKTIPDTADRLDDFETRLEIFIFIGVIFSSMWFLLLTSLSHSTSFLLSEFDLKHVKRGLDLFKTDTLELRFEEMQHFNGHCTPFFVSLLAYMTTDYVEDPLY